MTSGGTVMGRKGGGVVMIGRDLCRKRFECGEENRGMGQGRLEVWVGGGESSWSSVSCEFAVGGFICGVCNREVVDGLLGCGRRGNMERRRFVDEVCMMWEWGHKVFMN